MSTVTNNRVRIVNKSKDGITLDFKGGLGLKKVTWEEFNKMYEICPDNNKWCVLKSEWQEKMKKADNMLNAALIHYLQIDWKITNPDPNFFIKIHGLIGSFL